MVYMIRIFEAYGAVPDTLITCVFAAAVGECSITGWIKTTKGRHQDRTWRFEDQAAAQSAEDT